MDRSRNRFWRAMTSARTAGDPLLEAFIELFELAPDGIFHAAIIAAFVNAAAFFQQQPFQGLREIVSADSVDSAA